MWYYYFHEALNFTTLPFIEVILHTTTTHHHSATAFCMAFLGFKFHYHEEEAEISCTSSYLLTALQHVPWCPSLITQPPALCKICPHFMQQEPTLRRPHWSHLQVHLNFLVLVNCYHSPPCYWHVPLSAETIFVCPTNSAYWWWWLQLSLSLISVLMVNSI